MIFLFAIAALNILQSLNATEIKIGISVIKPVQKVEINCEKKCFSGKVEFSKALIRLHKKHIEVVYNGKSETTKKITVESDSPLLLSYSANKRKYYGKISFEPSVKGLKIVNICDLEKYLESVVSAEVYDLKNYQAYKAQAIIARTYTLANIKRHKRDGFNLCDTTHCQLYNGYENIKEKAAKAVNETRGKILEYRGKPAWTFYHSICGGKTDDASEIWPYEKKPYLKSIKDGPSIRPYCHKAAGFLWRTKINLSKFEKFAATKIFKTRLPLTAVKIQGRTSGGRARNILFISGKYSKMVSATDFYHLAGRYFGWEAIRSTMFDIYFEGVYIVFYGKGHGHGVGLCQHGADTMAELGYNYTQILQHYYQDLKLVRRQI